MNIDWLRYFIVLAENQNFHTASEIIGITPPTLSHAVAELERYYKLELINRGQKIKGLTPAGEKFLEKAREIVFNVNNMNSQISEMISGEPEGNISIAGGEIANDFIYPKAFAKILEKYPKIYPNFYSIPGNRVFTPLLAGKVDLALSYTDFPMLPEFNFLKGVKFPYVIVGKEPQFREWHEHSYITFIHFAGLKDITWPEEKFKRKIIMEVDSISSALDMCELGIGAAYVPEIIVKDKIKKGILHIVAIPPFERYSVLYLIWLKSRRPSPVFSAVLEILSEEILMKTNDF
jgi:DNA-binding transcriptional LysR family regulator